MTKNIKAEMARFFRDENGATAIEYGLMAGLISVGLLLLVNTVTANNLKAVFNTISDGIPMGPSSGSTPAASPTP